MTHREILFRVTGDTDSEVWEVPKGRVSLIFDLGVVTESSGAQRTGRRGVGEDYKRTQVLRKMGTRSVHDKRALTGRKGVEVTDGKGREVDWGYTFITGIVESS